MLHENDRMAQLKKKLAFRFFTFIIICCFDQMLKFSIVEKGLEARQNLKNHGKKKPIWINLDVLW
jgi:hypothetical protein